jgi:hypothetical protein
MSPNRPTDSPLLPDKGFFFFFKVILKFSKPTGAQGGVDVSGGTAVATQSPTTAPRLCLPTIHISLIVVGNRPGGDYHFPDSLQPTSGARFWSIAESHLIEIRNTRQPISNLAS